MENVDGKKWVEEYLLRRLDAKVAGEIDPVAAKRKFESFLKELRRETEKEFSSAKTEQEKDFAKAKIQVAEKMFGRIFDTESKPASAEKIDNGGVYLSPNQKVAINVCKGIIGWVRDAVYAVLEWTGLRKKSKKNDTPSAAGSNVVPIRNSPPSAAAPPEGRLAA